MKTSLKLSYETLFSFAAIFIIGAALALGTVLNFRGIHIICLAAVLPFGLGLSANAGAALTLILYGMNPMSVIVLCCSVCLTLLRRLFEDINRKRYPLAASIVCAAVVLSGGILAAAVSRQEFSVYLEIVLLSLVSGACVYLFSEVFKTFTLEAFKNSGSKGSALIGAYIVSWATAFNVWSFNLGTLAFMLSVYAVIHKCIREQALKYIAVISAGLVLSGKGLLFEPAVAMVLAALCPDVVRKRKYAVSAYVFVSTLVLAAVLQTEVLRLSLESALAALIFAIVPPNDYLTFKDSGNSYSDVCSISRKLSFISSGMIKTLMSDGAALPISSYQDNEGATGESVRISDAVYAGVCMDCGMHQSCYKESADEAGLALMELDNHKPYDLDSSMGFCVRRRDVKKIVYETARRRQYINSIKKSVDLKRDCFNSMINSLSEITSGICDDAEADEVLTSRLAESFAKEGIKLLCCFADESGCIELYFSSDLRISEQRLVRICTAVSGRAVSETFKSECDGVQRLVLTPEPKYHFEAGICQIAKTIGKCSGDYASLWNNGKYSYVAISDGMGTGEQAKQTAQRLVELIEKLINIGLPVRAALKTASEYMRCCFEDESFATVDLLRVNVFTGKIDLYKCGADKSYIINACGAASVQSGGYPLGIIEELSVSEAKIDNPGEITLVMATDGAFGINEQTVEKLFDGFGQISCEDMAAQLIKSCKLSNVPNLGDDITTAVVRVRKIIRNG